MATRKQKIKRIKAGIKEVQRGIDALKARQAQGTPGQFGAAGRGEVLGAMTSEEQEALNSGPAFQAATRQPGETDSQFRARINNTPFALAGGGRYGGGGGVTTLSDSDSVALAKEYGLTGLGYDKTFGGLTKSQAKDKAERIRTNLRSQTSALTSSRFNQESTSGMKKASENLNAKLRDVSNDSWLSKGSKEQKKKELFESTANEIAKLFKSQEDFNSQISQNPGIKSTLDSFVKLGGNLDSISSRLSKPAQLDIVNTRQNAVQDLVGQGVTDKNQLLEYLNYDQNGQRVGDFTMDEVERYSTGNNQDLSTYLSLSPNATTEQTKAWQDMLPERDLAQAEIMQQMAIPEKFRNIYFGTPEQIGILQEKKVQAEERKKIIEKQAKADERNLRAQADFAIDRNNADAEIAEAEIEENRLTSKNYMVGMLAKLGALNTTGAAPQAVATIEERYDKQATQLRTNLRFANREISMKLKDAVNDLELQKEENILAIQENLTLDREEVYKKIADLEAKSMKETFNILGKFSKDFRMQTEKYIKEAKKASEKYTKDLASALSNEDLDSLVEGSYIVKGKNKGVLLPDGSISPLSLTPTQQREIEAAGIVGKDTIQFFLSTNKAFRDYFIQNAIGSGNRLSVGSVKAQYQKWKDEQEAKKNKSSRELPGKTNRELPGKTNRELPAKTTNG